MTTTSTSATRAFDELMRLADGPRTPDIGDAVVLDGLAKTYGDGTEAVRGISLRIAAGEAFGILGPNGAGKSTTIGMLGTLVKPTGGRARVAGYDVAAEPIEVRRRIGFAMQDVGVDGFATVTELMVLQGRLHGLRKAEAARRVKSLLEIVGLEPVAGRRLSTLSGGTRRRVDLAASLMHLPPIVFLDEPTEGLDPRGRTTIWETLTALRRELGVTLVLTTHDMDEAEALCDRIGIVDRGALVVEGTPAALKSAAAPTLGDVYLRYTERQAA